MPQHQATAPSGYRAAQPTGTRQETGLSTSTHPTRHYPQLPVLEQLWASHVLLPSARASLHDPARQPARV
jgi:hypothetical protein